MGKQKRAGARFWLLYTLVYSLLFCLLCRVVFAPFFAGGHSFVWRSDGLSQVYVRLGYLNENFRRSVRTLLSGGGWTFPLYDFRQGLFAEDVQLGFPYLPALFWPEDSLGSLYTLLVFSGFYLAGLSFSVLGFYFRQKPVPVLAGAICYAFCGYAIYAGVRHPHFMPPMYLLPFLIIGAEKALRKEPNWVLLVSVFLSLTAHFGLYFSCMQAVVVVIYLTVRFFDYCKTDRLREYYRLWGRLCVWGGTGVLLGCIAALPALQAIRVTGRVGKDVSSFENMLLYTRSEYETFISYFFVTPNETTKWIHLGFAAPAFPAILWLFTKSGKEYRSMRLMFMALTLMLCIPAAGYMMSGFSSVTNRFCYAYGLCVAAIVTFMLPQCARLKWRDIVLLVAALLLYVVFQRLAFRSLRRFTLPVAALAATAVVIVGTFLVKRHEGGFLPAALLTLTCVSVCCSAWMLYSPSRGNYVDEFPTDPMAEIEEGQYTSLSRSAAVAADEGFFRVSGNSILRQELNYAANCDLNGLTMYPFYGWSSDFVELLRETEVPRHALRHRIYGLDSHTVLLTLMSDKYYALRLKGKEVVPYGFTEAERIANGAGGTDVILRNDNFLPLGFTYARYLLREDYDALEAAQKQQALLQAAVLEQPPQSTSVPEGQPEITAVRIPIESVETDGLTWADQKLTVDRKDAKMKLTFSGLPGAETYLRMVELDLPNDSRPQYWNLRAATDSTFSHAAFSSFSYVYSSMQRTQMIDLGVDDEGFTYIVVTFPEKGTFGIEDIQVWCQPMDRYSAQVDELRAETLGDISFNRRGLSGSITVSEDRILCLSIPRMSGWRAFLDGKEAPLLRINTGLMGLELPAGSHTVELRYRLPGLLPGAALSAAGLLCLLLIAFREKAKARKTAA